MELPVRPVDYQSTWDAWTNADFDEWLKRDNDPDGDGFELISGKLLPLMSPARGANFRKMFPEFADSPSGRDIGFEDIAFTKIAWTIEETEKHLPDSEGWFLVENARVVVGDNVLVPELAGWAPDNAPDELEAPYFKRQPDWVCLIKRGRWDDYLPVSRADMWLKAGVTYRWSVDVSGKSVAAFRAKNGRWTAAGKTRARGKFQGQPFPAITFKSEDIWR